MCEEIQVTLPICNRIICSVCFNQKRLFNCKRRVMKKIIKKKSYNTLYILVKWKLAMQTELIQMNTNTLEIPAEFPWNNLSIQ